NMVLNDPSRANLGLFGAIGGGAVIKNVTIDKSCSVYGTRYSAGLVAGVTKSGTILIENCGNEADVMVDNQNGAGVLGVNFGNRGTVTINNCYNTGNITGSNESAGLSGWLGTNAVVRNSYNSGVIIGTDGDK
ncbi:hypothetical protein RCJ22_33715, partial [Vibrio sp. FNV 38]|nr:hypothetical protein [Vibrio sp. FNV 38]